VTAPSGEAGAPRVFASVVQFLLGFAEAHGISRAHALEISALREADLADPDELVPYEPLVAIWRELVLLHPREPLGLRYASLWSLDRLGVVGYAMRHARDGHHALELCSRFSRLADPFLRVTAQREGDLHVMRLEHEPRVVLLIEPLEMLVLAMVRMASSLVREDVRPTQICFRHAARHDPALYAAVLGDVPIRFGAAYDGAAFPSTLLDLPLRQADPRMAAYLARHAETLLEEVAGDSAPLDERVRHAVRAALPGDVTADQVARGIGTSVRSLQRELHERGTSFSREVDAARKERAIVLLRRPELTVAEVAFMVGYAESRVFLRSFRRWTGRTPTEFRRGA
jgi:AraC-like DNA-binding protein